MKNFNLNKTDLEQLEAILRNNKNIERLYKKLYTLEIEDKKETLEYTKLLDYLSIVIEVEDKLYKEANLTLEKALSWAKLLFNCKPNNSFITIENIMKQNYDNLIISRIINKLLTIITQNNHELLMCQNKELTNIMTMLGINVLKIDKKHTLCKSITMKNIIENNIYYTFLSILQEDIENPLQKTFKEKLIIAKYNTLLVNKNIEAYLLKNNFNIQINTYIDSESTSELLQINKQLYQIVKNTIACALANKQIYKLLEINDTDYNNIEKTTSSILRQCMMKAALIFLTKEEINNINNNLQNYINNDEYQTSHTNNTISTYLINNCIKNITTSKTKIKTL